MNTSRRCTLLGIFTVVWGPGMLQAAEQPAAVRSEPIDIQRATDALQQLLSAYAAGDPSTVESLLDPKMIGYARVLDAARDAGLAQKHVRLTLSDTRTQIAEDAVLIQARWEKRFASIPARANALKGGACTFVMRPSASGWKLSGLNGDNPFGAD